MTSRYRDCRICGCRCVPRKDRLCGRCRKALTRVHHEPADDQESPGVLEDGRWVRVGLKWHWEEDSA